MRTFKLTLAYDGTNYSGWQTQPDRVTLQETLERALRRVAGENIRVIASGRTDAGVHALGQVVSFKTASRLEPAVLQRALNSELPDDVAVVEAAEAPDDFHAIASARRKGYRYVLHDGAIRDVFARSYCWHSHLPLDEATMHRAAQALVGKHDFASFQTAGSERSTTVRTVFELTVTRGQRGGAGSWGGVLGTGGQAARSNFKTAERRGQSHFSSKNRDSPRSLETASCGTGEGRFVTLEIEADGFLYNMVRAIVGTLVEVGQGRRDESWPGEVLAARDRQAAGRTAPPQGLFLVHVDY